LSPAPRTVCAQNNAAQNRRHREWLPERRKNLSGAVRGEF